MSPPTLAERLRHETRDLHTRSERAGVMGALLAGRLERAGYIVLLRNLHAIYAALEPALDARRHDPRIAPLRQRALYRTTALADDLAWWQGPDWPTTIPCSAAAEAYATRLHTLAEAGSPALAAHAYTRYLGDLHGGQILAALVARRFALSGDAGTAFYRFGPEADVLEHRTRLRAALATLPVNTGEADAIVAEARWAFEQHVRLFEELDEQAFLPLEPRDA